MGRRAGAVSSAAQECVAAGDFYQALQVYHGLCSRAKLAGDVEGKETSAESIALEGARTLLEHRQWRCASELLAARLFESWEERSAPFDERAKGTVSELSALFPAGCDEQCDFLRRASKCADSLLQNDEDCRKALHEELARALMAHAPPEYGLAAHHLARADDAQQYAHLVELWAPTGFQSETDLFVCRACLHLLAMRRADAAAHVHQRLCADDGPLARRASPDGPTDWRASPLCRFVDFFLQLVRLAPSLKPRSAAADIYGVLRQRYTGSLDRDPHLAKLADHAAGVFLGFSPPKSAGLSDMLSGLMGMINGA